MTDWMDPERQRGIARETLEDPYALPVSDTELLTYAAARYDSAELDHPDCVVIRIALPPNSRVTGDLRADLTAARRASQDR